MDFIISVQIEADIYMVFTILFIVYTKDSPHTPKYYYLSLLWIVLYIICKYELIFIINMFINYILLLNFIICHNITIKLIGDDFMNDFFVHTFEINAMITYEAYKTLKKTLDCFPDKESACYDLYPFICTAYAKKGFIIKFRMCSNNERFKCPYEGNYKLTIKVNPSRLIQKGTYKNKIYNIDEFEIAVGKADRLIKEIFGLRIDKHIDINDFKLSRIDFAKDIKKIHEAVIKQFILVMKRKPLRKGYKPNTQLEDKCENFNNEDSYNVLNESKGIEFVLYNKHKAAADENYPEDVVDYYSDTLRMELRCNRKYIKKQTKDKDTFDSLCLLYNDVDKNVRSIYDSMFKEPTSSCYLGSYFAKRQIEKYQGDKKKRKNNMMKLLHYCTKNSEDNLETAGKNVFSGNFTYNTVQAHFNEMGFSPVPVTEGNIGFIQSPDSLLGFEEVSDVENKYYETAKRKCKGRNEVHLYV